MATNKTETVIFLHIPKAAGTTLHQIIERQYPLSSIHSFGADALASINHLKMLPNEKRAQIRVLKGHMGYGLHQYLAQPVTYITILRNPIDRIISYYYFVLRNPTHYLYDWIAKDKINFEDFANSQATTELDNGQTRLLAGQDGVWQTVPFGKCTEEMLVEAKQNLQDKFSVVGLATHFDETLLLLQARFGWKNIFYAKANVTKVRPGKKDISEKAKAGIAQNNYLDFQLYEYTQTLLQEQIRDMGPQFNLRLKWFQLTNHYYGKLASSKFKKTLIRK